MSAEITVENIRHTQFGPKDEDPSHVHTADVMLNGEKVGVVKRTLNPISYSGGYSDPKITIGDQTYFHGDRIQRKNVKLQVNYLGGLKPSDVKQDLITAAKAHHFAVGFKGLEESLSLAETPAADTLQPGAGSGGTESKAQMLATFTALLAQLGKEDLSNIFNMVQDQFGPGKTAANIPNDAAQNNAATIATKQAVKEDIEEMFSGDDLTEEFKEKATVVFEAAVNTRVNLEMAQLEEEFEQVIGEIEEQYEEKLQEQANSIFEEVSSKLDQYLDYVIEQWMEENKVAIESSLRSEIAENFITGLQNLFAEHYINVPEERLDIVAELKQELDETKEKLNEAIDDKLSLKAIIDEATKEATLEEVSEGLAKTQQEKLRTLAEGIDYSDADSYKRKLSIVRENYFSQTKPSARTTGLITEEIDGVDEAPQRTSATPPSMEKYVQAIAKSVK